MREPRWPARRPPMLAGPSNAVVAAKCRTKQALVITRDSALTTARAAPPATGGFSRALQRGRHRGGWNGQELVALDLSCERRVGTGARRGRYRSWGRSAWLGCAARLNATVMS